MPVSRKIRILTLGAAVALAAPVVAAAPALAKDGDKFGDWTVGCPQPPQGAAKPTTNTCRLMQIEQVKAPDGKQVTVLKASFFHLGEKDLVMFGYLPLGYAIPAGVRVSVDGGKEYTLVPQRCIPQGCEVATKVEPELLAALKKGNNAKIEFQLGDRNATVAVSLKGLSEGLTKF